MKQFSIKNYFDGSLINIAADTDKINNAIETITENFVNLYLLEYNLKCLNDKIKKLKPGTNWFAYFYKAILSTPNALAQLQLNEKLKNAVKADWFDMFPNIQTIAASLHCRGCANLVRTSGKINDGLIFADLLVKGKINIVSQPKKLYKSDLNTIPQIFHQLPVNIKFDNPNIVTFNELTEKQHIFICYALKKSRDIIDMNCNTPTALFNLDENFTPYQVEKEFGFKKDYLGGSDFINDIVKLNFTKIAFMVGTVVLPISVVNIGYDTATKKNKFQLSADFLAQKGLIEQYRLFYDVHKMTGLTISQLFSSKYKVPELMMGLRMINEIKWRESHGQPFNFVDEAQKYNLDLDNKKVTKRKLYRLFGFLNHEIQFFKDDKKHEMFALGRVGK